MKFPGHTYKMTMNCCERNISKYNVDFPISALKCTGHLNLFTKIICFKKFSSIITQKVKRPCKVGQLDSSYKSSQEWKLSKKRKTGMRCFFIMQVREDMKVSVPGPSENF